MVRLASIGAVGGALVKRRLIKEKERESICSLLLSWTSSKGFVPGLDNERIRAPLIKFFSIEEFAP